MTEKIEEAKKMKINQRNHLAAALRSKIFQPKAVKSEKAYDRNKDKKMNEDSGPQTSSEPK